LGFQAGFGQITGNYNIDIGNTANVAGGETNTIRIGTLYDSSSNPPSGQFNTYIAGIRGATTGQNDAIPVVIDSAGQLGTVSSSRRYKEEIQDMGDTSNGLMRLRPVTFRYQKPFADGSKPVQYGLIAEEVAEVYPDLVAHSADGQIETVKYQVLDSMLLNEVQRLNKENQALQERLSRLEAAMASMVSGTGVQ
jgi:hypothetical protein